MQRFGKEKAAFRKTWTRLGNELAHI